MHIRTLVLLVAAMLFASSAYAQLTPYKDYDIGTKVSSVTMVKVHPNMIDDYLEGIRTTWAASSEVAKKLGHIEDYWISVSELPLAGDFNVVLGTTFKSGADLEPSKAKYEAFMKEWGEAREKETREIVKDYPGMREIVGEYRMREITFK